MKNVCFFICLTISVATFAQSDGKCVSGDCKNGIGKYEYKDLTSYEGQWKNAKPEGKGIQIWKNGRKYVGDFKNGLMDGRGMFYYASGDIYEGDFKAGNMEGQGTFTLSTGGKMGGTFLQSKLTQGYLLYKDGGKYEGAFVDGVCEGKGELKYPTGEVYTGMFVKGKKEGFGELRDSNGKLFYSGNWKNDQMVNPEATTPAKEQRLKFFIDVLGKGYRGFQVMKIDNETGRCGVDMDFTVYNDYSVQGTTILRLTYAGKVYSNKAHFKGTLDPEKYSLSLTEDYFVWKDELPIIPMYWKLGSFRLTLLNDNDRKGHYGLKGTTGDGFDIEVREK